MVTVHAAWIVTNHEKRYEEKEEELSMSRVYNFSAGPAVLPEEVLKEAAEGCPSWR